LKRTPTSWWLTVFLFPVSPLPSIIVEWNRALQGRRVKPIEHGRDLMHSAENRFIMCYETKN
jgi:hypothetical protein